MENNNHIDQLFKGVLKNFESRPLNDVWSRIEDRLNNEQTPVSRTRYFQYAAVVFAFLSLCLISVPLTRKANHPNNGIALELPTVTTIQNILNKSEQAEVIYPATALEMESDVQHTAPQPKLNSERTILVASTIEDQIHPLTLTPFARNVEEFIYVPDATAQFNHQSHSKDPVERIYNLDVPMNALTAGEIEERGGYEVLDREIDDSKLKIELRGMYVGVNGSYNQTTLLEYGSIFRGERPIQPSLKFGISKGITIGYNFNNHFGLQGDYIYNSVQGQNYITSDEDVVTEKSLTLNYNQYSLSAKFKQARVSDLTEHPIVANYIVGTQYGVLRDYRLPQEKRWESTESLFKEYDWSLVLGLEYDVYVQENLFVSFGTRATIGTDISRHNEPLDDYAKRNFVFGVKGGLNYVFR